MNLFSAWIPAPENGFVLQLLVLVAGIICTGIGAAMSLDMRIIPNPGGWHCAGYCRLYPQDGRIHQELF